MSETPPRRRLTDRQSTTPTFVGAGSKFTGDLECGDLVVGGAILGNGDVRGAFTLTEEGSWEGEIHSFNAVIAGTIDGALVVGEKLEIRKTARIRGSVRARTIAVAQGAVIEGEMAVTSGAPVVHYDEKRSAG